MTSKKNVAVVFGGDSSEAEVSVRSAANVYEWVDKAKYNVYKVHIQGAVWSLHTQDGQCYSVNKNDFTVQTHNGQVLKFDFALIIIHGTPGENGVLQSYFDMIGLPYSSGGVFASAITFNKFASKAMIADLDVPMAKGVLLRHGDHIDPQALVAQLGLPMFVKPNNGGSSYGVTKVKEATQIEQAVHNALNEGGGEVILESFISGVEVTNGVMILGNDHVLLPITEVVTEQEFFDYEAKYKGKALEITPARLSPQLTSRIQAMSLDICRRFGCRGIARVDYIVSQDTPYFLEINTVPGMTATSFIPQQVQAMGLSMPQVLTWVIEGKRNE